MAFSSSAKTIVNLPKSPISPVQPVYRVDSEIHMVEGANHGGIFLFETERHLMHTNKYTCTLHAVCLFGCWLCTIPSIIVTSYAQAAVKKHQLTRAKILFNVAFIFSFFGLLLFLAQAGYLMWLARYFLHRFITP
jgi:hypothetical protein